MIRAALLGLIAGMILSQIYVHWFSSNLDLADRIEKRAILETAH